MSIALQSATYVKVNEALRVATERFIETGIAYFEQPSYEGLDTSDLRKAWREQLSITSPTFVRAYLRQVAKELKRPFVHADKSPWAGGQVVVTIPRRKQLNPIAVPLILCAHKGVRWGDNKHPVVHIEAKTNWVFHFSKGAGAKVFDNWLKNCYDDLDFRKALTSSHRR